MEISIIDITELNDKFGVTLDEIITNIDTDRVSRLELIERCFGYTSEALEDFCFTSYIVGSNPLPRLREILKSRGVLQDIHYVCQWNFGGIDGFVLVHETSSDSDSVYVTLTHTELEK